MRIAYQIIVGVIMGIVVGITARFLADRLVSYARGKLKPKKEGGI